MQGAWKNQKGFSLAEAVIATVVLGIAAAGVLLPFTSGASVRAEGARLTLAAKLASDLMEKVIKTPFDQITTTYGSYIEPEGQVKNFSGVIFSDPAYANFSRGVNCAYDTSQPFFVVVTVWVKYKGSEIASLSRLIGK